MTMTMIPKIPSKSKDDAAKDTQSSATVTNAEHDFHIKLQLNRSVAMYAVKYSEEKRGMIIS